MRSIDAVLDTLDDVVGELAGLDFDTVAPSERFAVLERMETVQRRLTAVSHAGVARLEPRKKPRASYRRFVYPAPNACCWCW